MARNLLSVVPELMLSGKEREMSDVGAGPEGFFIDWDGKLRPIGQPGKGLRCEVDIKAKYVMVFNKYGRARP